jgi:hypothetical protein
MNTFLYDVSLSTKMIKFDLNFMYSSNYTEQIGATTTFGVDTQILRITEIKRVDSDTERHNKHKINLLLVLEAKGAYKRNSQECVVFLEGPTSNGATVMGKYSHLRVTSE